MRTDAPRDASLRFSVFVDVYLRRSFSRWLVIFEHGVFATVSRLWIPSCQSLLRDATQLGRHERAATRPGLSCATG